jgi:predicted DNA-binding transcriptional regulator YafY
MPEPYDERPARPSRALPRGPKPWRRPDRWPRPNPIWRGSGSSGTTRLIEELRLATGRHATAEELAAALRVDIRTVERDIARLRELGVPIAARRGPGGGFRLDVPPTVAPVHLSSGEIAALIASVASVGPYVSSTAQSALNRLIQALQPT